MLINVSDLSGYLYCKRKFFLERVLGLVEVPKEAIVRGSLRHELYDKLNKAEEPIICSIVGKASLSDIESRYRQNYSKILRELIIKYKPRLNQLNISLPETFSQLWPYLLDESKERTGNVYCFISKHDVFGKELWNQLIPKIYTEYYLESQVIGLKGIIDRLEFQGNAAYIPYEIKTGNMPQTGTWPSHNIQIAAYLLLLKEKFNPELNLGYIRYADSNEDRAIVMNPFLKDEVLNLRQEIINLMESKVIPAFCDNDRKCASCSLKSPCFNFATQK